MAKKKKKKINYSNIRGLLYIMTSFVLISVMVFNYYSKVSVPTTIMNQTIEKKESLEEEKSKLQAELDALNDPNYITKYAREKFVFTREGETVILLPQEEGKDGE